MAATWSSDHAAIYCGLQQCLAIANDLSLAIGSSRIDWKVTLMQLGHQFNSYNNNCVVHLDELFGVVGVVLLVNLSRLELIRPSDLLEPRYKSTKRAPP
jgi:hypothetical protein